MERVGEGVETRDVHIDGLSGDSSFAVRWAPSSPTAPLSGLRDRANVLLIGKLV